jgi:ribosomal protein S18 acetylase RimI-like enzyme
VPLTVRSGDPSDAAAAVGVWQLAITARRGGSLAPGQHQERVRGNLMNPDAFFAIAEAESGIVGMALGMQGLADDGAGPPICSLCHVAMVFVHPDRWGQGVGRELTLHLLRDGRDRGFAHFQLWTQANNRRAQRLYEGIGFGRSGREKVDELDELIVHYEYNPPKAM